AARAERRAVVEARPVRGSLQLPVLGQRAGPDRRRRRRGVTPRQEGLPLYEQSLLGEAGGQRRDDQEEAPPAPARRISGGVRRGLSGSERDRQDFAVSSFRYARLSRSPF